MTISRWSRRGLLGFGLAAGPAAFLPRHPRAATPSLQLTPACADADEVTPAQTEGPYFTPNSPERGNLVADGIDGTRIALVGFALDPQCRPIAGALVDLWHANAAGVYDNQGYRLRGHQFTDAGGRYVFETIVPGLYPGRTRHFHVKVQPPGGAVLTTQLYFRGEPGNERDRIFDKALLMDIRSAEGSEIGRFDFVVARG
ncbi:MAG TPA: intradiol ring-cleavage dioxygenase [Alphaproteobacteria bacterium]|nr:intradiol ring-cleavage dioxygenase [Alphaproteobacteria bacterium]